MDNDTVKTDHLIEAQHIFYQQNGKIILQDISLIVKVGQLVTIIGPNGSGKSTLLKIMVGLTKVTQGQLIHKPMLRIGYMPQKLYIDQTLPINVKAFLGLSGHRQNIESVLDQVGMIHGQTLMMHDLSGGEFQRVLLARALLSTPNLLVLDEPVQGVDVMGQTEIYKLVHDIRDATGCGVLLVSHDLHFVHSASQHVVCLNHHICCQGAPQDVQNNPDYQSLFGYQSLTGLSLYTHRHNPHDCVVHGDHHNHVVQHHATDYDSGHKPL